MKTLNTEELYQEILNEHAYFMSIQTEWVALLDSFMKAE